MEGSKLVTDVTKVGVRLEFKKNIGNFENVTVSIDIQDWVRPDDGSAANAIDRVYALVDTKLGEKLQEIDDELRDSGR